MDFVAGAIVSQRFAYLIELGPNFLLPILIEDWCSESCNGQWHIEGDFKKNIVVSFDDETDRTLFYLSQYNSVISIARVNLY